MKVIKSSLKALNVGNVQGYTVTIVSSGIEG